MIDNSWAYDLPKQIYSAIKYVGESKLISKFPNINFTDEGFDLKNPIFPSVFVDNVSSIEQMNDIENNSINAVLHTIQVNVVSNTQIEDTRTICIALCNICKSLRFDVSLPLYNSSPNKYEGVFRATRLFGAGDSIGD